MITGASGVPAGLALSRRRRGVSPCYPAKPNAEPPITGVAATAQARRDPKPQHSNKPNSSSLPHFARAKREPAARRRRGTRRGHRQPRPPREPVRRAPTLRARPPWPQSGLLRARVTRPAMAQTPSLRARPHRHRRALARHRPRRAPGRQSRRYRERPDREVDQWSGKKSARCLHIAPPRRYLRCVQSLLVSVCVESTTQTAGSALAIASASGPSGGWA